MAADDKSKTGGGSAGPGSTSAGPGSTSAGGGKDAKKPRNKSLDTQSLKVLAPRNEVARAALEMRVNLEKFMPPGPLREQLIEQLKADVTPILRPELQKYLSESQKIKEEQKLKQKETQEEKEQRLNEAIDRAAKLIKGHLGQFETYGPVKETASVPAAVVEHLRSVLHDPRRGRGEFQVAIGIKDKKHFSTSRYFVPSATETFAYERLTSEGVSDLQVSGYFVVAIIHVHQEAEGRDAMHFFNADIEQADSLQSLYPEHAVQSFMLTPGPENQVLVYSPNIKDQQPLGALVGSFDDKDNFTVENEEYVTAFADSKLKAD